MATASSIINTVAQYIGTDYVWGGATPSAGFDCSGLMQYSFAQNGITLPRTSQQQYRATNRVDLSDLKPGDLVFFNTAGNGVSHVGLYIGNNSFIHAPRTGKTVEVAQLNGYYEAKFISGGRVTGVVDDGLSGVTFGGRGNDITTISTDGSTVELSLLGKIIAFLAILLICIAALFLFFKAFDIKLF